MASTSHLLCWLALAVLVAAAAAADSYEIDYSYGDSYDLGDMGYGDEYGYYGDDDASYYEEYGVYSGGSGDDLGYGYYDYYDDLDELSTGSSGSSLCTTDTDGKVKLSNGTARCDLKLSGADKVADKLTSGIDGIYKLSGCHNGRAMYKRKDSPAGEERLLWFSKTFSDWDLSKGDKPPVKEKDGDILLYGQDTRSNGVPLFVSTWRIGADLTTNKPNGTRDESYIPISIKLTCADGKKVKPPPVEVLEQQQPVRPILTDDEMEQKYKLIYEKYGRRPEPNPNVNFSFVIMLVMIGLTVVLAIPYMLVKRSKAAAAKGYQPVATTFSQVIQQSKKKQSGHIH